MAPETVYIYRVTTLIDGETDVVNFIVAQNPIDAVEKAVQLDNDAYGDERTTVNDIVEFVQIASSDSLFFTKSAREWFWDNYGNKKD